MFWRAHSEYMHACCAAVGVHVCAFPQNTFSPYIFMFLQLDAGEGAHTMDTEMYWHVVPRYSGLGGGRALLSARKRIENDSAF